jgi:hypothetical protein
MTEISRRQTLILASGLATVLATPAALAAPRPDLWPRWQAHDAASHQRVDHIDWDRFLSRYRFEGSDGVARLAYAAVTDEDRRSLSNYLDRLGETPISTLSQPEQFSYWVNMYNALTVKTVLDHYPVGSIRDIDISPGLFANGPWGVSLITVEGEALTLDDIEHRILRPIWRDPRIHYVVNCAAIGCPNLPARALRPSENEQILNEAAVAYVNHTRGLDIESGGLTVSRIYDWFDEDFGDLRTHLAQYARGARAEALASGVPIVGFAYDWSLNDIAARNRPGN